MHDLYRAYAHAQVGRLSRTRVALHEEIRRLKSAGAGRLVRTVAFGRITVQATRISDSRAQPARPTLARTTSALRIKLTLVFVSAFVYIQQCVLEKAVLYLRRRTKKG